MFPLDRDVRMAIYFVLSTLVIAIYLLALYFISNAIEAYGGASIAWLFLFLLSSIPVHLYIFYKGYLAIKNARNIGWLSPFIPIMWFLISGGIQQLILF